MRVNTAKSIETANAVYERFGSWKAARDAARFVDGKYILRGAAERQGAGDNDASDPENMPSKS